MFIRTMSGMPYSGLGSSHEMEDQGFVPLGYIPYVSLTFMLTTTMAILLLSSWVVYTIKTTRSLHKPHNIFVANLLISGMIIATAKCFISGTMIVSSAVGVESIINCHAYKLVQLPFLVNIISFVLIPVDKVIAIRSPFKHRRIMTPRNVGLIICSGWLIAIIPTAFRLVLDSDGVTNVPEYGTCVFVGKAFIEFLVAFILPTFMSPLIATILNIYLTIKAYQIHKQITKESTLHGVNSQSERMTTLKKKQRNIKRHMKPIKMLLVIVLGSTIINMAFPPLYYIGEALIGSQAYQEIMQYMVAPNSIYLVLFLHPLVYGLYFKQVREPMMKHLRGVLGIHKVNSVAPQPQRTTRV